MRENTLFLNIFEKNNKMNHLLYYTEDKEHECYECGEPIDHEGYCSGRCFEASMR